MDGRRVGLTLLLAGLLFFFAYSCEHILEQIFLVDYRFLFPFASDLTRERAWMALAYFPFLLIGYGLLGLFIHGPLRLAPRKSGLNTFLVWCFFNLLALSCSFGYFLDGPVSAAFFHRIHPLRRPRGDVHPLYPGPPPYDHPAPDHHSPLHLVLPAHREKAGPWGPSLMPPWLPGCLPPPRWSPLCRFKGPGTGG